MENISLRKFLTAICLAIAIVLLLPTEANASQTAAKEITSQSLVTDSSGFPALKYCSTTNIGKPRKPRMLPI